MIAFIWVVIVATLIRFAIPLLIRDMSFVSDWWDK